MSILDHWASRYPRWRAVAPGLVIIVAGVVGFAIFYDALVDREDIWRADDPLYDVLARHRIAWVTSVLTVVTNVFGPVILPALVVIGALVWRVLSHAWRDPLLMIAAMALSTGLSMALKLAIARQRPDPEAMAIPGLESSYAFPSGHTVGATTLVLVTGYLIWRRPDNALTLRLWFVLSTVVIMVVGASRLYLGYHFLTDVLSGFCLGLVVLGMVVSVARLQDSPDSLGSGHVRSGSSA